jgi:hypothetical protein
MGPRRQGRIRIIAEYRDEPDLDLLVSALLAILQDAEITETDPPDPEATGDES